MEVTALPDASPCPKRLVSDFERWSFGLEMRR